MTRKEELLPRPYWAIFFKRVRESVPRQVDKTSGALREEIGFLNSQGKGEDKLFFYIALS